ncbi:ammonium transporter [Planktotalea sp.]|uniref:ammonium transporter n=1 Tax=Planktotalea sp. TaxID=2029877 RepID=UPI0032975993
MNQADTAWMLVATTLVFFMTLPGLALFYGGMVRARNVISVYMQCFAIACCMAILWFAVGYSIAFGGEGQYWGGISKAFLQDITLMSQSGSLPEILFFAFQMVFAIITPALILGAYVERVKFSFVILFSSLWMLLVYAPVAHWIWGGGFLSDGGLFGDAGVRDFAGGIVIHETSGIAALLIAVIIGPRLDRSHGAHNPGLVLIGAAMLWVGWLGFNGGARLAADASAALAMALTILAGATSTITWMFWGWWKYGEVTLTGMVTGTIAGLAAITPASGYVGPTYALLIGFVAGIVCQEAVYLIRHKLGIDDALDVFAVHGVGGILGSVMLAALGAASWSTQAGGILIVGVYTTVVSLVLIFFCKGLVGLRVDAETEELGLDLAVHKQRAYHLNS